MVPYNLHQLDFFNVYFVVSMFEDRIPVCLILLKSKSQSAYKKVFSKLSKLFAGFSGPELIVSDFEQALIDYEK